MNDIQLKILDIYKEFSRVCKKNGLRYYAIGGTCIGAIRHHGFIPWDDDLDVAMPFEDYQKFFHEYCKELRQPYEALSYLSNPDYVLSFGKVHDTTTTYIESGEKKMPSRYKGIYIDVMPLVGIPEDENESRKFINKLKRLKQLDYIQRQTISELQYGSVIRRISNFILHFIFKCLPKGIFNKKYEATKCKYKFAPENNVFFPWRLWSTGTYKSVFPYRYFKSSRQVAFEDTKIAVPELYDDYLKDDFGDYMKLPPKDKRHSVHDVYALDTKRSYKEYVKSKTNTAC